MTQYKDLASILFAKSVSGSGWITKLKLQDSAQCAARPCAETWSRRIYLRFNLSMSLWSSAPIGHAYGKESWRMSQHTSLIAHFGQHSCPIGSIGILLQEKRNLNEQMSNYRISMTMCAINLKTKKFSHSRFVYLIVSDLSLMLSSAVWSKEEQIFS